EIAIVKNAWTHVTLPKVLWDKSNQTGNTGFTFANLIGIGVKLTTLNTGGTKVWIDDMELLKGVGTRGDYLYTWTFFNNNTGARANPPIDQDGKNHTIKPAGLDRHKT